MADSINFSPSYKPTYLSTTTTSPQITPFIPATPLPPVRASPYRDIADLPVAGEPNTGRRRVRFEDELPTRARGRTISLEQTTSTLQVANALAARRLSGSILPQPVWQFTPATQANAVLSPWAGFVSSPLSAHANINWGPSIANSPAVTTSPLVWATKSGSPNPGLLFLPPQPTLPTSFPTVRLHPLLDPNSLDQRLGFDLSRPDFAPVKFVTIPGGYYAQPIALSAADLREPATSPPVSRMTIIYDRMPQWPVDIQLTQSEAQAIYHANGALPPINVGEVLFAIHRMLHRQITHIDWAKLGKSDEESIARAYTRRCKATPGPEGDVQRSQGVKRIDYLLDRYMFQGLVGIAGDVTNSGWRLVTS